MVLVVGDGVVVGIHADTVGEHLLLVVEEGVGAEVVGVVHTLVHCRPARGRLVRKASHAVGRRGGGGGGGMDGGGC